MMNTNQNTAQQNGVRVGTLENTIAVLYLTPMNGTFERKTINVPYNPPDVIKIGRQTNAKTLPTQFNGYFDSKVLSRSHAEVWADRTGKIWIRDIKSSNGTFVNGHRLSPENKDSEPHELRDQDMLELGIDIVSEDQKTVVHHKVAARVEHAGFMSSNALNELSMPEMDPSNPHAQMVGQAMGHMRRKSGQSDLVPLRSQMGMPQTGVQNAGPPQRNMNWLQNQITMETVIKRLTVSEEFCPE
jgi:pSer/pThr/pTyr-binding forkhead associated (FHA) protein